MIVKYHYSIKRNIILPLVSDDNNKLERTGITSMRTPKDSIGINWQIFAMVATALLFVSVSNEPIIIGNVTNTPSESKLA